MDDVLKKKWSNKGVGCTLKCTPRYTPIHTHTEIEREMVNTEVIFSIFYGTAYNISLFCGAL